MAKSNNVCRSVLDTQSVVKDQITNLLVVGLVSTQKLSEDECRTLCQQVSKCVDDQTSGLIDRILNEFNSK